jgi:two-component system cell cycle sensor histidine kinase/response regulator CckA
MLLRVLQIEDSKSDAALILRRLDRAGYEVQARREEDAPGMREALARQPWDVILADHGLGNFNAPGALRTLQESGLDIPFIVVSGVIGEDLAVSLMKSGVHDYLMKSDLARLAPAIAREIRDARIRREYKASLEALRQSEERLTLATQATQLGIFDFDPRSQLFIWSEQAMKHFGLTANEGATYADFLLGLHPDDRDRVDALVKAALRNDGHGGQFAAEFRTVGIADGIDRCLEATGRVFFDAGEAVRFVGVTIEITERKRLENQFLQSQKLESIGRLAGGVAHDFNNLLTVITGYSEMILGKLPAQHFLRHRMEEISGASNRATVLTRQLLAFSGRQISRSKTISLNQAVRDMEKMLVRLIGADIQVVLALDPEAGSVLADPGQIEQVLMNLAVNSRDAMPSGGRLLIQTSMLDADEQFARTHLSVTPGRYVVLEVSDTGIGMSSGEQARIFEPFFTTKEPGKGTGLGLSTVYGIVTQSGGSIWVTSEPGIGASFRLLFPAVARAIEDVGQIAGDRQPSGKETILMAEDEPSVRAYIREVLNRQGYTVLQASNGLEALDIAQRHAGPIDLLITDSIMPKMCGVDLAKQFVLLRPGTPVLCISAHDCNWPEVSTTTGYIQKPFTIPALLNGIRALLTTEPSSKTSARKPLALGTCAA